MIHGETHKQRPGLRWFAIFLGACALAACRAGGIESGPLVATRDTAADTVFVKTASGSVWEKPITLREDLRIGSLSGDGPAAFGEILQVAVERDGSILVFDGQVPALRRFSSTGRYLGTVGRRGQGPGEYGARPTGLMVDHQGRIILSDPSNTRLSAFSSSGEFLGSLGAVSGLRTLFGQIVSEDQRGQLYIHVVMVQPGPGVRMPTPWPIGAEVRRPDGKVLDTIPPPLLDGKPASFFAILPDGSVLAATTKEPVFEVQHEGGGVLRVEMPFKRTPYTEAERAKLRIALRPAAAADGATTVSVPEEKPAYVAALVGPSGTLWLRRPVQPRSEKEVGAVPRFQASVLDVFKPDGTYLGVVELPPCSMPVVVGKTELYAIQLGKYDEQYVVRYKLELP